MHSLSPNHHLDSPSLLRRLAAIFYDILLLVATMIILTTALLAFTGGEAIEAGNWYYRGFLIGVVTVFYVGFWCHGGQTLGMRAWRIKLVGSENQPLTVRIGVLRLILAGISWLALGFGYLWMLFDRDHRCWHDQWSHTRLVLLPKQ